MNDLQYLDTSLTAPRVLEVKVALEAPEGEGPRSDKGTISTFLQSRIHESFTRAADQLYAMSFLTTEERIAISGCIGDVLSTYEEVLREKVPSVVDIEVPMEVAQEILRNAVRHVRRGIVRVAQEEELGVPISSEYLDLPDRDQGHNTLRVLIETALVDEMNAQQHYDNMLEVLEQMDLPVDMDRSNRTAIEEIFSDERDHEKILLRMLGEELPTEASKLPETEETFYQELIAAAERFLFDPNSTEGQGRWRLLDPEVFDRNSIVTWVKWKEFQEPGLSFIMGVDKRDGEMKPQAVRFDRDKWDEKKAAEWWNENEGSFEKEWSQADWVEWVREHPSEREALEAGRHSFEKCMECDKPPEYELMWADGRAHAWFCGPHLNEFIQEEHDRRNGSDIPWIKEIIDEKAFKNPTENTNPNVKDKFIKKAREAALFNMEELRQRADELKKGVIPKTLAVDFDGTISEYDGFKGIGIFGRPIDGAKQILKQFKDDGWYIVIDTCRGEVPQIIEYLISFEIPFDEVNNNIYQPDTANSGKPIADYRIDDSSIHFDGDWTSIYTEVLKREKEKEYSPLEAIKIVSNSGGAFAYDPTTHILLDFIDPFGHRTQPQDYPDLVTWGDPRKLRKKRKEKRRGKEDDEDTKDISSTSSVLDYPRNALDPAIWEYEEGSRIPKLRTEVKDTIIREFEEWAELVGIYTDPADWIKDYLFVGSSATVQWKDTSDIDITVVVDKDVVSNAEIVPDDVLADGNVADWLGIQVALGLNGYEIEKHPVNYWIASDEKPIDMADAIYNLYTDTWIKPPPEFPEIFDPEEAFTDTWAEARDWANKFDLGLSETRRDINDFVDLHNYSKQAGARGLQLDELSWINTKLEAKRAEIGQDIRAIINDFKKVYEQKQQAFTAPAQEVPEGHMYFSRNWLPAVLIWKWLDKYNYLELLKDIMQLYKDEPTDVITAKKVWKLKEVLA